MFFIIHTSNVKILLGDFNAKVGRENIFKPTTGNESLHQDSNDKGVRKVNTANQKILSIARSSCNETFLSTPGPLQMRRFTTRMITY